MKNKQPRNNPKKRKFFLISLDEAGRGSLAGPVMAAAVVFSARSEKIKTKNAKQKTKIQNLKIRDSKKLSSKKREELYQILKTHHEIEWGTGSVSAKIIDKINILEATKLAMKRAVKNLEKKIGKKLPKKKTILIVDGNQRIGADFLEMPIVKADEKLFLCSCASIIAKVKRDALMKKYHKFYPQYQFLKHKGYPTKEHRRLITKYGLSPIQRKSFRIKF